MLSLDKSTRVQQLNDWILSQQRKGINELQINIAPSRTYSNVCAPVAGVISYYRTQGMKIAVKYKKDDYVRHTRVWSPLVVERCEESEKYYPFDKVWTFETSEGVTALVNAFVLEVRKSDIVKEGVIKSIEWCMNEVMDNVLQHSNVGKGYVMAQIHKQAKVFAFCVFDSGIGFYNSLKSTKHHPEKPIDAITLALQEKITRDESVGQGNGLWGLSSIVAESNGSVEISSCGAKYTFRDGNVLTAKENGFTLSKERGTAYLDVRLSYDSSIDIAKALGGYSPCDIWLENLEDGNSFVIKVSDLASGTGTRQSAIKLRNIVLNIVESEKKNVILDFRGINLISSSFSDELFGKIIAEKGMYYFLNTVRIINLSPTNAAIFNRSVQQRMAQIYYK